MKMHLTVDGVNFAVLVTASPALRMAALEAALGAVALLAAGLLLLAGAACAIAALRKRRRERLRRDSPTWHSAPVHAGPVVSGDAPPRSAALARSVANDEASTAMAAAVEKDAPLPGGWGWVGPATDVVGALPSGEPERHRADDGGFRGFLGGDSGGAGATDSWAGSDSGSHGSSASDCSSSDGSSSYDSSSSTGSSYDSGSYDSGSCDTGSSGGDSW